MNDIDNNIAQLPKEITLSNETKDSSQESQSASDIQSDYEISRDTYKGLIEKGNEAIELLMDVAKETEHPRAFEVLANLLKTQADNTDKLTALQKRVKDLRSALPSSSSPQSSQPEPASASAPTVFVGTTTDLQRMLREIKQENVIDVTARVN